MMIKVYLGYAAMWLTLFAAIAVAAIGGTWWTDRPWYYVVIAFGAAFVLLLVAAWFQSYALTRKMILDDEA